MLTVRAGTGLTSCLSVRLHDAVQYRREHGHFPDAIDSSEQFSRYRDREGQDVSAALLGPFVPDEALPQLSYNHGWQFRWYDAIEVGALHEVGASVCRPSRAVADRARHIRQTIGDRTVVLYRGNDKSREIARTPYAAMRDMASDAGGAGYFVQTDEQDFLDYFRQEFGDVAALDEIPRIHRQDDGFVLPAAGARVDFAINYLAVTVAMASAGRLLTTTGNTGLWALIYRGRVDGVWQYQGREHRWKRL